MAREYKRSRGAVMSGVVGSVIGEKSVVKHIDRDKTCPLLLRVFIKIGCHHSLSEYARGNVPSNELKIYTWMDATLSELCKMVKEFDVDLRSKGTYFDFALVFPSTRGPVYRMRDIGTVCSGEKGADDNKTLEHCRFNIGDYLDIAITLPPKNTSSTYRR